MVIVQGHASRENFRAWMHGAHVALCL